jgi:uncharacterized protein (TIGR03435 family)
MLKACFLETQIVTDCGSEHPRCVFKNPGVSATSDAVDEFQPALIEAVQSQLGLKLAKKKMPVEVLVVDRLERTPTEN